MWSIALLTEVRWDLLLELGSDLIRSDLLKDES